MKASKALRQAKTAERDRNQKLLEETTKSVADFTEKERSSTCRISNATQVKLSLDAKKEAIDNAIAKLEEMLKLARGDLQSTMQF